MSNTTIDFYEPNKGLYCTFTNYHVAPMIIDGLSYDSVEHWYQSNKFTCPIYKEIVRKAKTPHQSKVFGSMFVVKNGYAWRLALNKTIQEHLDRGVKIRSDWEDIKESVMSKGLDAKFRQHPELKKLLLSTGDKQIREKSSIDYYWGTGKNNTGKNRLGHLLSELRMTLRNEQPSKSKRSLEKLNDFQTFKRIKEDKTNE